MIIFLMLGQELGCINGKHCIPGFAWKRVFFPKDKKKIKNNKNKKLKTQCWMVQNKPPALRCA